ncbi:hypothetical protein [Micromonospora ureilytica]|uniref:Uncharacterized protein n=2 Tax=Micromonospora TaxID=1873 RepID=A0ABS0JCB5_9ACTN|nr:hypothetical protein [Micromonospora ureilytica]MBG6064342.1 hypothetical protein [Micromonospora ureilytica]
MRKLTYIAAVALAAGAALLAAMPSESSPGAASGARPQDAQEAILAAFDRYDVVAGASPNDIFLDLIRNPAFPSKADVIAVECGNSLYQPLLDRYIAGEDVPLGDVRQVWRNTTQPSCGFSVFYERLFPLVREVNRGLLPAEKLRVVACDPPIDWSKVTSPEGLAPFEERDRTIAALMKSEVLSKDRKALMLFGISHLLHGAGSAVAMYEQEFPGVTYTVAPHFGFQKDNKKLEKRMAGWPVPSVVPFAGTWLGQLDASYFESRPGQPPAANGYPGADAYLYTGPRALILRQQIAASTVLDTKYITELRRRATAVADPPGGLMHPETFFRRELESGALEFGT